MDPKHLHYRGRHETLAALEEEYQRARRKFPPFNSPHEGYAVILEEMDEAWEEIKRNDLTRAKAEMIQVGAMVLAFLRDLEG